MMDAPLILHDWSTLTWTCYNCGKHISRAGPECTPTTAEPGADEE